MQDHQPWRQYGKCTTLPQDEIDNLFYIGKGKSPKAAKAFCAGCMVRKQCLFFALYYNETGIWAGTTDAERSEMRGFVMLEVELSIEVSGFVESRDLADFLPSPFVPQDQSNLECA